MALSAIIQKHSSSSSCSSTPSLVQPQGPSVHANGPVIKNYFLQTPTGTASLASNIVALSESSSTSSPLLSFPSSPSASSSSSAMIGITSYPGSAGQLHPQGPSVLLGPPAGGPGGLQQSPHGYITIPSSSSSSASQTSVCPSIPVLAHHQSGPTVLQAQTSSLNLPQISGQFQEVLRPGGGNMVQLTPVCYGGPQAQGVQVQSASPMGTLSNFMG